jgi:hypothetical protein
VGMELGRGHRRAAREWWLPGPPPPAAAPLPLSLPRPRLLRCRRWRPRHRPHKYAPLAFRSRTLVGYSVMGLELENFQDMVSSCLSSDRVRSSDDHGFRCPLMIEIEIWFANDMIALINLRVSIIQLHITLLLRSAMVGHDSFESNILSWHFAFKGCIVAQVVSRYSSAWQKLKLALS